MRASGTAGGGAALRELARSARAEHPGLRVELHRPERAGKLQALLDGELEPLRLWLAHRSNPAPAVARLLAGRSTGLRPP